MATRRPLVLYNGLPAELPSGDTMPIATLATGTPNGSKFIRDDGTLAVPAGGGGSGVFSPMLVYANGLTVGTSGSPADIGTITFSLPPGASRWVPSGTNSGPSASCNGWAVAETAAGTLAAAGIRIYSGASASGSLLGQSISGGAAALPASVGNYTPLLGGEAGGTVRTATTLYVNQATDSANAGTISVYMLIVPLP